MPTYEYKCKICSFLFEEFQSMLDEPVKSCPKCSGSVQRLISKNVGVLFKGNGFYVTDSKSSTSKADVSQTTSKKVDSKKTNKSNN